MVVIIAGGRDIDSFFQVHYAIAKSGWHNKITEVVCGAASGADSYGKRWAEKYGIPVKIFKASWDTHGRAAGPIRNQQMAKYADALILIWNSESRGSRNMLMNARKYGLQVRQHIVKE